MSRTEQNNGVQKTTEDYLEAILMIFERQGYTRSSDVAEQLGVAKPSVTYTTKRLKEKGYITTDHAGMLVLTESGRAIATSTYNRHKTLAKILNRLGVDEEQALADACKVEHDLSEESFQALSRLLNLDQKTIDSI